MLDKIKKDGIFILNTSMSSDEVLAEMSNHDKDILQKKNIKMYVIDASKIAMDAGLPGKISTIMETVILNNPMTKKPQMHTSGLSLLQLAILLKETIRWLMKMTRTLKLCYLRHNIRILKSMPTRIVVPVIIMI